MPRKVLIIGATSAIAQATAKKFAAQGDELYLMGRNAERLRYITADLNIRYRKNYAFAAADLNITEQHASLLQQAISQLGGLDVVLIAHGVLSDQQLCTSSFTAAMAEFQTNCLSVISLLILISHYFEQQQQGCIAVISSVAGERGRQRVINYAATKAALSCYLQGLRNRLFKANVQVLTIKPGIIDTPMNKASKKNKLWAQPEVAANDIINAINKKKSVVYTPFFWRYIMLLIKLIPETIFRRMNI